MSGTGEELTPRQTTPARGRRWFRRPSHWAGAAGLLLCVAALAGGVLLRLGLIPRSASSAMTNRSTEAVPDPRLDYSGPFLNVRPDVGYVGDSACVDCHKERARTYGNHPMGQSLAPVGAVIDRDTAVGPVGGFKSSGLSFEVKREGKRMIHRETRLDDAGKPVWSLDLPVDYVIGSGTRGASFLFQRDGYLFQTPISWYSQKRVWDLSPGLSSASTAGRPVVPECLFCHANHAQIREDTLNAYEQPIFDGFAIGCERCHGPGERHVKERKQAVALAGKVDHTIVNPAHLKPEVRDAVCAQCHLAGEPRVLRRGRGLYDFRPGMPLHLFWSVFVQERPAGGEDKAVNHFEQMHLSRCFQRSSGTKKLGCVSCHDAHELPAQNRRVEYYRGRCLECHREHGCTVPLQQRLRTSKEDSCMVCHMPPYSASDIPHTAATNHRIVRRSTKPAESGERKDAAARAPVPFYPAISTLGETELNRDRGIALARLAGNGQGDPAGFSRDAVDLLTKSLEAFPDDAPAWDAKGQAARRSQSGARGAGRVRGGAGQVAPSRIISTWGGAPGAVERRARQGAGLLAARRRDQSLGGRLSRAPRLAPRRHAGMGSGTAACAGMAAAGPWQHTGTRAARALPDA